MLQKANAERFLGAPINDKMLVFEATAQLIRARVDTLGSARHFTASMGELDGRPVSACKAQQQRAARIGYVVEQTARVMPFRCVCLQQVLAVGRMLRRRHIPATVYLGVLPNEISQTAAERGTPMTPPLGAVAHAWVKSGDRVVNGGTADLDDYVIVGIFS